MSKKASIPVIAAVMVGLLMVGCSGGGEEPAAKAEFVKQVNAICDKANEQVTKDLESSAYPEPFTAVIVAIRSEAEQIGDLTPPEGDEQQIDAMVGHLEKSLGQIENNMTKANRELAKAEKIAEGYGLAKICLLER